MAIAYDDSTPSRSTDNVGTDFQDFGDQPFRLTQDVKAMQGDSIYSAMGAETFRLLEGDVVYIVGEGSILGGPIPELWHVALYPPSSLAFKKDADITLLWIPKSAVYIPNGGQVFARTGNKIDLTTETITSSTPSGSKQTAILVIVGIVALVLVARKMS